MHINQEGACPKRVSQRAARHSRELGFRSPVFGVHAVAKIVHAGLP